MALLCGAYSVFLRKFSCRVSHVRNLRIYGKIMFQMSVLPCLTVRRITVPSYRSSQFLCICQMLFKSSGQIYSSHIGSKICFLFLSDCESVALRHLQDVCENLGVLNREFSCWCHTKSVGSWHGFMVNIVLFEWNGLMLQILSVSLCSKIVTLL